MYRSMKLADILEGGGGREGGGGERERWEYLKAKIDEPATNSNIKDIWDLYTGISDFNL